MTMINCSLAASGETLVYNNECELLWQIDDRVSAEIYNNGIDPMVIYQGGDEQKRRTINAPITGYNYVTTKFKIWCNSNLYGSQSFIEYNIRSNGDEIVSFWNWHVSDKIWDTDHMTTDGHICYRYAEYNMPYYQFTATGGSAYTLGQQSIWYDKSKKLGPTTSGSPHYYRLIMSTANSVASAYLDNTFIGSGAIPPGKTALSAYSLYAQSNHDYTVGIHSFKIGGFSDYEDALNWE